MALIVVTWDPPGTQEQVEAYAARVPERLHRILAAPAWSNGVRFAIP